VGFQNRWLGFATSCAGQSQCHVSAAWGLQFHLAHRRPGLSSPGIMPTAGGLQSHLTSGRSGLDSPIIMSAAWSLQSHLASERPRLASPSAKYLQSYQN